MVEDNVINLVAEDIDDLLIRIRGLVSKTGGYWSRRMPAMDVQAKSVRKVIAIKKYP